MAATLLCMVLMVAVRDLVAYAASTGPATAQPSSRSIISSALAGLGGILAVGRAPAVAQAKELTFLTIASFVPDTDKELKRQLDEWGAKNKVKVRLDIIAHLQLVTKKAAEVQARSGHDLTALGATPISTSTTWWT